MKTLLVLFLCLISIPVIAQDFPFGKTDDSVFSINLNMKRYSKDTSAHAVVLAEFASARIAAFGTRVTGLVFEYHVKIKFFDNSNFNLGTVRIPLRDYARNVQHDGVRALKGLTFYADDNGSTQSAKLDTAKVYETRENSGYITLKFAMPAMRAGCIIEYKYEIWSPYNYGIPTWYFQSDIPKIYSEYNVHIPSCFNYNILLKGPLKLTKNVAKAERSCFTINGVTNPCSDITYAIADVPAFIEEEYTSSPNNFKSAIKFELADYTLYFGEAQKFTSDWKDIDKLLKNSPYFGGQFNKAKFIQRLIPGTISAEADKLTKAHKIYQFIQKNYKWNQVYGIECQQGLEKLPEMHGGDVADINLALAATLRSAGMQADPVLLSTRENGIVDKVYPTLNDFDYVIVKLNIDDKEYFLDATDPLLAFGLLPLRCLNGQGRVISASGASYWADLTTLQKKTSTYSFDITLNENGKLSGVITIYSSGYSGFEKREKIRRFNTTDEFVEDVNAHSPKLKIIKAEITNIDSLDLPLVETYEVEIKNYIKNGDKQLNFDPFLGEYISTNPLKMDDRTYPVDFGMPSNVRVAITLHVPAQYKIDNHPKNINLILPGHGGKFATYFEAADNMVNFSYVIQLNNAVYDPEEYQTLKELYTQIILAEKTPITLLKN